VSRGPGRWQRVILDRLRHEHVICVNDVVVANVLNPSRADFVAARRGAATLASAGRVGTGRITLCSDIGCRDGGGDGHRPLCRGAFTEYLFVATITWSELLWARSVASEEGRGEATLTELDKLGEALGPHWTVAS